MQRDLARISLFLFLAFWTYPNAVPWREKNVVKVAATLPARLIDSIMAQGNWNILFQEGPFSEFQRQIAIANHFALRGDSKQADSYFQKAGNALDIAYASLRGKFSWPRAYSDLKTETLPWGENRETFQDFILCRLQLYVESGLAAHYSGMLRFENLDSMLEKTEKQLGTTIQQKDNDLGAFLPLVRSALQIRNTKQLHPTQLSIKFAVTSDSYALSVRNYWSRRIHIFKIFENIYHGNMSRAHWLANFLRERQGDQLDTIALALMYIQIAAHTEAEDVLLRGLATETNRQEDTYVDFAAHSELLQNLYLSERRIADAEAIAEQSVKTLNGIREAGTTQREDVVYLTRAIREQEYRLMIYAYLNKKQCPDTTVKDPGVDLNLTAESQIRERIFAETCGGQRNLQAWQNLLALTPAGSEGQWVGAHFLKDEKKMKALANERKPAPVLVGHLRDRNALLAGIKRRRSTEIPQLTLAYLRSMNLIDANFATLEWGIVLENIALKDILSQFPETLSEKMAQDIFLELHRAYASEKLRGKSLDHFSPGDAAYLSRLFASQIADLKVPASVTLATSASKILGYSDEAVTMYFNPGAKQGRLTYLPAGAKTILPAQSAKSNTPVLLYGKLQTTEKQRRGIPVEIAPLYSFCDACSNAAKPASRLFFMGKADTILKSDLSDNFSVVPDTTSYASCEISPENAEDTIILSDPVLPAKLPCDLSADNVIIEYDTGTSSYNGSELVLAMGWKKNLVTIWLPLQLPGSARSALLFDFFQRVNRRQIKSRDAFLSALERAEKSFPDETALQYVQLYESIH